MLADVRRARVHAGINHADPYRHADAYRRVIRSPEQGFAHLKVVCQLALRRNQLARRSFLNDPAISPGQTILSAFSARDMRCVMRITVRPANAPESALATLVSERGSSAEVRLVHNENGGLRRRARARGDALSLTGGYRAASLADDGVVGFG